MDFNNNMLFWFFAICGLIAGYIIIKDDNDRLKKKEMEKNKEK